MGKQNSSGQQTFRFLLLFLASFFLLRNLFGPKTSAPPAPTVAVPTLEAAFKGIDRAQPPLLDKTAALNEVQTLTTKIGGLEAPAQPSFWSRLFSSAPANTQGSDEYSYWARFRIGLLREYVLRDSIGANLMFNEVAAGQSFGTPSSDRVHAQAIYQAGDLMWHSTKPGDERRQMAATTLEQLVHKGRGSSQFLDTNILVPQPVPSSQPDPALAVLAPASFKTVRVRDLRGTVTNPNPEGLPDRVDQYYSTTSFHKAFDFVVKLFGNNPKFSYGLAILFFAIALRVILQPLNKKQYASTKGMQEIAPAMKKIQDKYKEQPEKQMQAMKEIRELQAAHGVSPMTACGLGLVQMPIFFLLVYPLIQHYEARMELSGASFLWIHSLSRADYPLLAAYGLSQFLSFRLSATPPSDPQQAQMQTVMSFLMPLMIPFFLRDYPSAFTLFWMTFNVLSTVFQYRMVKAADPNHNFVRALMRSPFTATVEESLPQRPNGATSSTRNGATLALNSSNGAFNGAGKGVSSSNGTTKSSGKKRDKSATPDVLSKITPFDLESAETADDSATNSSTNSNATQRATQRRRRRRR